MIKKNNYKTPSLFFLGGILYALSFPFKDRFSLSLIILISTAIFFSQFFQEDIKIKHIIKNTLFYLWGYNLAGYYWLTFTLKTFGGLSFPFNFILWQFFTLIIAPHFYAFILMFHLLRKYYFNKRKISTTSKIFILSSIWPLLEYFIPQQFPAHFGHPWFILHPYLKPATIFGVPFYSFLSCLIGINLYFLFKHKKMYLPSLITILSLISLNFFLDKISLPKDFKKTQVRIIQANIGNDLKLKSEEGTQLETLQVINLYKELSLKKTIFKPDLIIWPETAYPLVLNTKIEKEIPTNLKELMEEIDASLLIGTYDLAKDDYNLFEQQYNSAIQFDLKSKLSGVYHKRILIPFGEGLPFGRLNKHLSKIIKNISFFAIGKRDTLFKYQDQSYITLICYEILFPRYIRSYLSNLDKQPRFFINITNDSWYGKYSEQEQHLLLSKWRALEFSKPLVRATNTGISTVINIDGQEISRLENFEQGVLDITLKTGTPIITLYQKYGILNFLFLIIILSLINNIFIRIFKL